jgi:hypothetical protein
MKQINPAAWQNLPKKSLVTKTMKPRKEVVSFVKLFKGIKHDRN